MPSRAPLFVLVYVLWLGAVAACGLLAVTGHTMLAYLPALAVLMVTAFAAGRAGEPWSEPPAARRAPVLMVVLGGIAFGAAAWTADAYLGVAGRDADGVVVATGCVQIAEHGGGCGPVCDIALAEDRRPLGRLPCDADARPGDPAAVRIDPAGFAAGILARDALSRPVALAAGWAGVAGAGLAGVLLCNAVWLGPARDARRR
ncbi:hypothetical protein Daura_35415 [Dactylosporangium aurantiacum]|uniref:Uncharacterized protein n=1 Tax=Dactylosporangium aurantiacum TaxID=35754 RepID=A0A9Q9IBB0_9ACTN|nr:hypothetical protein [Dactylosporangium aurantiacum]MDG6103537.1 hypothetical protein [Dactylosporangium aurantiacum]UWZ51966.1 hypothetical protein Daura_35415 [Dactylosporangium aurantiacum]